MISFSFHIILCIIYMKEYLVDKGLGYFYAACNTVVLYRRVTR